MDRVSRIKLLAARTGLLVGSLLTIWLVFDEMAPRSSTARSFYVMHVWVGFVAGLAMGAAYIIYRRRRGGPPARRPPTAVILAAIGIGMALRVMGGALVVGLVSMLGAIVVVAALTPGVVTLPSMRREERTDPGRGG